MTRRFINWFPLGMTYAFLYMGRYNLTVVQNALGTTMSNEDFGWIFGVGTAVYALSFLVNGPLVDKIGGKKGIIIAAVGAALANIVLGVLTYLVRDCTAEGEPGAGVLRRLRAEHVFSELRRGLHHQGQGLLVPRARARRVRRHLRHPDLVRRVFRLRLGPGHRRHDQGRRHRPTQLAPRH